MLISIIDPKNNPPQTIKKRIFHPSDSCSRMSRKLKTSLYDLILVSRNHAASSGGPWRQPMAAVNLGRLGAGMAIAAA